MTIPFCLSLAHRDTHVHHTSLNLSDRFFFSLLHTHTHTLFSPLSPKYTHNYSVTLSTHTHTPSLSHSHTENKQKNCNCTGLCTQPLSISLSHTGMHRPYADSVPLFHTTPSVQTSTLTCPNTLLVVNTHTIQAYTKMNLYSHCLSFSSHLSPLLLVTYFTSTHNNV